MLIIAPGQGKNGDIFSIFFNMKVYCVFSLEWPRQYEKSKTLNYPKSAVLGYVQGTQG